MPDLMDISVKGKRKKVPAWQVDDVTIVNRGKIIKTARIFDEYWLEKDKLPNPERILEELRDKRHKPDLFTFAQRVPETMPKFGFYFEWDNLSVIPISTYDQWYKKQISSSTGRNIRASQKRGVVVLPVEYNEDYVRGIMSIYNESPIRHGKKYWHYKKDFETVKKENGTYADRSTFLAAYHQNEMIGYLKIVWDKHTGAIMQILSRMAFLDNRPNNALLAEAVRQCCSRGVGHLLYEKFIYGNKNEDSLTKFKQNNGFVKMNIPRYYVPLTKRGILALRLGLHKSPKERLPNSVIEPLLNLRARWYGHRLLKG
jgi:hypothetical protein